MRNSFYCGVGGTVSADIAVPEHARELAFYSKVLTTGDSPLWRDDLTNNQGVPIIGLGERSPAYASLPLQWMPHFQVADVAQSVARAVELGGQELMHGKDDDGRSLWAGLMDPIGAAFGIIPAVAEDAAYQGDHALVGRIPWLSLTVPDVSAVTAFYEAVIGWSPSPATATGSQEMRGPGGDAAAEICSARGNDVPAVWLLSLPVGDLTQSLQQVREHGGEVVHHSQAGAAYAVIRDPVGVYIALQGN